ncbi:hypothetical protein GW17_00017822 [Ensete ventricosum]|nr:hypothetical protein GW17_00017822 [Ensete ventricosum]RZR94937.1 hypothetical protein BHM03_00023715 [Ensete ventricosum]
MRLRSGNASSGDERRSSVKWTAILCACSFALGILFTNRSVPNPSFNLALTLAHDLLAVAGPGRPPMPPARSSPPAGRSRSSRSSRKIAQPKGSVSIPTADLNGAGGAAEHAGAERRQWLADDLCVKSAEKQGICCDRDQHRFQQQEEEGFRDKLRQLEHEKGIVIRFMIGHRNVKYHEAEYWKFGEEGNKYFRHATGQIYAISKDLAMYISINQ